MKIWNEIDDDVFNYFQWFDKNAVHHEYGYLPKLGVFSVNASNCTGSNSRRGFLSEAAKTINNVFQSSSFLSDYTFYLFANIEISKSSSVIIKSKKLWKNVNAKWSLVNYNCIQELEFVTKNGNKVYAGVASFSYAELEKSLEIVASNPKVYTIIARTKTKMMDYESFEKIFENSRYENRGEIDYFNLIIKQCLVCDIVFRFGDSSEAMELAVIYQNEFEDEFAKFVKHTDF